MWWIGAMTYGGLFEMAFSSQAFENGILWCSCVHARCFSHFLLQMMRYGLIIAASTPWLWSLQNLIDSWCESLASKYLPCYIVSYQVMSSHFISCCFISWYIIYHMVYHIIEELVRITRGCFFAYIIWRLVCATQWNLHNFLWLSDALFRVRSSDSRPARSAVWHFFGEKIRKELDKRTATPVQTSNRSFLFDVATGSEWEEWEAVWSNGRSSHKETIYQGLSRYST